MTTNPITKLRLENFGPHRDLTVSLTAGLNLLRGPNRAGKSWILRAISLVLFNSCPAAFNRDDALCEVRYLDPTTGKRAPFFAVTAEFADGSIVRRYRQNSVNQYVITLPGGSPQVYDAVGSAFFAPVAEVTGIKPLSLDGRSSSHLHVKLFGEPLFLLSESESRQDDILSRLLGINVIGAAEVLAEKDSREAETEVRRAEEAKETASREVARWAEAPALAEQAEGLRSKAQGAKVRQEKVQRGRRLLDEMGETQRALQKATERSQRLQEAEPKVRGRVASAERVEASAARGRATLEAQTKAEGRLRKAQATVRVLEGQTQLRNRLEELGAVAERAQKVGSLWQDLLGVSSRLQEAQHKAEETQAAEQGAAEAYEAQMAELGVCPLCGQPVGGGSCL